GFPGHSRRGAVMARAILWKLGVPFALREAAVALIRHHLKPFHLAERPDAERVALTVSQTARCDWLALLAEADARGRICADSQRLLDNVGLFAEFCREQGCLDQPYEFPSDHSRFVYFQKDGLTPLYHAYDDTRCQVVLMSGLPGSGKNHWIESFRADWPVVSLDQVRLDMDIAPTDDQGVVINEAREQARRLLREGRSFVWNATSPSRVLRNNCVELLGAYKARVRIVYLEVDEATLHEQNRQRSAV